MEVHERFYYRPWHYICTSVNIKNTHDLSHIFMQTNCILLCFIQYTPVHGQITKRKQANQLFSLCL